jgi:transaldolase
MADNPLKGLARLGQSAWLDFITRDLIDSGRLQRLIDEDALTGMTTNPTIFAQAIQKGEMYDADIRKAPAGADVVEIYEKIAVSDVQRAADAFRPVHDAADGSDGFVSIEVRPTLARDTEATVAEARRLWNACDRPNVMIKVPGTAEGLPAIERLLAEGINVNVTLLFSIERYREVIETWYAAMERRAADGLPLGRVASVASFFVSRLDTKVDPQIVALAEAATGDEKDRILALRSQLAVANARLAYAAFEELVPGTARFQALEEKGARMQRPLWASTSTKDPSLPDIYYVDTLVAPHSVNTLPPHTLDAYRDHGRPEVRIREDLDGARSAVEGVEALGISLAETTRLLEEEGVGKFADSFEDLLATIEDRRSRLDEA